LTREIQISQKGKTRERERLSIKKLQLELEENYVSLQLFIRQYFKLTRKSLKVEKQVQIFFGKNSLVFVKIHATFCCKYLCDGLVLNPNAFCNETETPLRMNFDIMNFYLWQTTLLESFTTTTIYTKKNFVITRQKFFVNITIIKKKKTY